LAETGAAMADGQVHARTSTSFSGSGLLTKHMTKFGQRSARVKKAVLAHGGTALGLLLCLALISCGSEATQVRTVTPAAPRLPQAAISIPQDAQPAASKPSPLQNDYRIQPLDTIQISVFKEADLSVPRRVSPQGYITYPLLGSVQVGGLTVGETETKLKDLLGRCCLVSPQVTVLVDHANSRRLVILGQVKSPGSYDIGDEGITLVQAIARAGGFTDVAATDRVSVIRSENGTERKIVVNVAAIIKGGDRSKDLALKPDDVVSVPETIF
jgi:protein involved in polysaccharide export with SLBB domain